MAEKVKSSKKNEEDSALLSAQNSETSEPNDLSPENKDEGKEDTVHWIDAVKRGDDEQAQRLIARDLEGILSKHGLTNYQTLFLYDTNGSIENFDLNRLYEAASQNKNEKDILLILHSSGGSIEPAYLISKALKHFSKQRFVVAIPRRAKSAATLVSLGADEIHMGMTSQLGPIDPQIGGLPALGLVNALDTLAGLACRFPEASKMLSSYLEAKLDLRVLGYFNRVTESAVQYAERLLASKKLPNGRTPNDLAKHLVDHYKDHGFVIDFDEAKDLLGSAVVRTETKEYAASNDIFQLLDLVEFILRRQKKALCYIGSIDAGLLIMSPRQ